MKFSRSFGERYCLQVDYSIETCQKVLPFSTKGILVDLYGMRRPIEILAEMLQKLIFRTLGHLDIEAIIQVLFPWKVQNNILVCFFTVDPDRLRIKKSRIKLANHVGKVQFSLP